MCLLVVLQAEYLRQHSLPCKLPRLPQKLFPPFLCFAYPFLGTQMSAVVTYCREASGSDGCHKEGGSCWRRSASSVIQTPLLNSHFLGTYIPVWLTFKQAKSQPNRWAGWQATKTLWMYIVWVWRVKLPVRNIQVAARHTATWQQCRDMPWTANFELLSSATAASIDRKSTVTWHCSWPRLGGIQEGIAMERRDQQKNVFPLMKGLSPFPVMIPSSITEDFYTGWGKQ